MKTIGIVILVVSIVGFILLLLPFGVWQKFRKAGDKVTLLRLLKAKLGKIPIQKLAEVSLALAAIKVKAGFEQLMAIHTMGGDVKNIQTMLEQAHDKGQKLTFIEACRKDATGRIPKTVSRKNPSKKSGR